MTLTRALLLTAGAAFAAGAAYAIYRVITEENPLAPRARTSPRPRPRPQQEEYVLCLIVPEGDLVEAFRTGTVEPHAYERLATEFRRRWYGPQTEFSAIAHELEQARLEQTTPSPYSVRSFTFPLPRSDARLTDYLGVREAIRDGLPNTRCEVSEPLDHKHIITLGFV